MTELHKLIMDRATNLYLIDELIYHAELDVKEAEDELIRLKNCANKEGITEVVTIYFHHTLGELIENHEKRLTDISGLIPLLLERKQELEDLT